MDYRDGNLSKEIKNKEYGALEELWHSINHGDICLKENVSWCKNISQAHALLEVPHPEKLVDDWKLNGDDAIPDKNKEF